MSAIKSLDELRNLKEEALEKRKAKTTSSHIQVTVAMGTCGIAAGARETMRAILNAIAASNLSSIAVRQSGCMGMCDLEPIVQVEVGNTPAITYGKVTAERAKQIMNEHVANGRVVKDLVIPNK